MPAYPNTTIYYPGLIVQGYTGNPGTGGVIVNNTSAQAGWGTYKAATAYQMTFTVQGAGTAGSLKVQPYGSVGAGLGNGANGAAFGNPITVSVPASGPFVAYSMPQNLSLNPGGYVQFAIYGAITVNFNGIIWFKQVGI